MSDYSTIQQHQPLRTPQGWSGQEKALIVQLDEVFDDIYRRFGRLRIEDMNKEFRTAWEDEQGNVAQLIADVGGIELRVESAEGDISSLNTAVGQITISVANKYDKISGITITAEGIDISGSKYLKLESGNSLTLNSGATLNIKASGNSYNAVTMDNTGITIGTNGKLFVDANAGIEVKSSGQIEIKSGGKFIIDSTNFTIDSSGNVTINGNGEFSGKLVAATGTFTGDLSASQIKTGTLDCSNLTVQHLSASSITTGTLNCAQPNFSVTNFNASSITTGTLNCTNLTISGLTASDIKGGTLTLGGTNNTNGQAVIYDSTSQEIGRWDNTGLTAKGTFSNGPWTLGTNGLTCSMSGRTFTIVNNTTTGGGGTNQLGINVHTGTDRSFQLFDESKYVEVQFSGSTISVYGYAGGSLDVYSKHLYPSDASSKIGGSNDYWDDAYITTVHSSSSRGVKHDIRPLRDFGYEIDQLSPVSFKYNEGDDETHYGLIWEDTVGVLPVICHMDLENEDQDKAKTITYMDLIPVLLKEIQSLRKRVRALEAV